MSQHTGDEKRSGPLAWMAGNHVAANVVMFVVLAGGFLSASRIRQEVFPEIDLDRIQISVPYPGASPEEVEQGIVLAIEEAVRGIDGVKEVSSSASEGNASVSLELDTGAEPDSVLADVQNAIDRVTSLPDEIERPVVRLVTNRREVISLILHGDIGEAALRALAEQTREELLLEEGITQVDISGTRPIEISVEVPEARLREYGLTLEGIAQVVSQSSIELPAGAIRAESGEILVRLSERRDVGPELEEVVIVSRPDGTNVTLGQLATIRDGFRETDQSALFNGQRAARIRVYRVGDETPIAIADTVRAYAESHAARLPPGVGFDIWNDSSQAYRDRIDLLLRNAGQSLILVLLSLSLFLELRLAFWVAWGIPTSVLGSMILMPWLDVSFNMISLFGFILTVGIVVDDAIVVGDAVYEHRMQGHGRVESAVRGVREVASPVIFSVLTTLVAFTPLLFLPGMFGKFMGVVPVIVMCVLTISLLESLLILPAHLAGIGPPSTKGLLGLVARGQAGFDRLFRRALDIFYSPVLRFAIRARYLTISVGLAVLVLTVGFVKSGGVPFTFMPRVESDIVNVTVEMPFGTAIGETRRAQERIVREALALLDEIEAEEGRPVRMGLYSELGSSIGGGPGGGGGQSGSHLTSVSLQLVPMDQRTVLSGQFVERLRSRVGEIPGAESLRYSFTTGASGGSAVDVELSHTDMETLQAAASRLAGIVASIPGTFNVDDGFSPGKDQIDLHLLPLARTLGFTETNVARQVRSGWFGAEAIREQRGRDELRVYVRRPRAERESEYFLEEMWLRAPTGGEVPLRQVATVDRSRAYTSISRLDGRRVVHVTADVDLATATGNEVLAQLRDEGIPALVADTPGLSWEFGGERRSQSETFGQMGRGLGMALLVMFIMMAMAFRNYLQPLIIMLAIPFGLVGAVAGHLLTSIGLSMISVMGMVALAGVAVNDSLVLIDVINENRARGLALTEALLEGGVRRFRPVLLTSLTTFAGLAPIIYETSVQARFLAGMAVSLGWGVVFTTVVTLVYVPAVYVAIDDIQRMGRRIVQAAAGDEEEPGGEMGSAAPQSES